MARQRGSDYLDAVYGPRLGCSAPADITQERVWPRVGHLYPVSLASDLIPEPWIRAAYRAAWLEASSPGVLAVTLQPLQRVKRQKVDVIEREFFDNGAPMAGAGGIAPLDSIIDGLVAPFLCPAPGSKSFGIWSIGS